MRVYELANELDVSTQEIIDILNKDLGLQVSHHMSVLDDNVARRVRVNLTDKNTDTSSETLKTNLPETSKLKKLYGDTLDSLAFGIGIGLLLTSDRGDNTRRQIREEIKKLGKEITDPVKIGGQEVLDLIEQLPAQVNDLSESAVNLSTDQITPMFEGILTEAADLVRGSNLPTFSTNGNSTPHSKTKS